MPRVLANGKTKLTFLTTAPADPKAPTATELNDGIDMSCAVLTGDFEFGAAESAVLESKGLCAKNNEQRRGTGNHTAAMSIWRYWAEEGGPDETGEDEGFQAIKAGGTYIWIYARRTDKDSDEEWAEGDEIFLGGLWQSDTPQQGVIDNEEINVRVIFRPQGVHDYISVAAGSGTGT